MKILLISSNITTSPYPIYPLGLSIIARSLKSGGHDVRQVDYLAHNSSIESLKEEIRTFKPSLLGISIRNIDNVNLMNEQYYIDTVTDIIKEIRTVYSSKIILGGAGFSLLPEIILKKTGADYGIVGEGERLMASFADNAERGVYPDESLLSSREFLAGNEIMPAEYDKGLLDFYMHSGNIVSVQTKRGCTHKCIYCTYPVLEGERVRPRNPSAVVDDIERLLDKHGAKYLFFVDSVFNDDEGAYEGLVREMLRRRISIPWTGFFKPRGMNNEIVQMMKETGLLAVEIGSDAATDVTLKKLGKGFTFADIVECNDMFTANGISVSHYFMFGGPGETEDTVREGINNIKGLKKSVVFIFMGIRILPDTQLARLAIKEKIIGSDNRLLEPVYYVSPAVDKKWLEQTLTDAFADLRHCVFPPDTFDNSLKMLHKLGYTGTLWDLLLQDRKSSGRNRVTG